MKLRNFSFLFLFFFFVLLFIWKAKNKITNETNQQTKEEKEDLIQTPIHRELKRITYKYKTNNKNVLTKTENSESFYNNKHTNTDAHESFIAGWVLLKCLVVDSLLSAFSLSVTTIFVLWYVCVRASDFHLERYTRNLSRNSVKTIAQATRQMK